MAAKRSDAVDSGVLDQSQVLELARRRAEPAVTILLSVAQPVAAHPELELRLRDLVDRALDATESWWGSEAAERLAAQLERPELRLDPLAETARGLAVLATPDDSELLRLPFAVEDQLAVNRTFATRQLFEGISRNPRYRVVVLDGPDARLYDGQGHHLTELDAYGFPLHVEPPHEQDTPRRDFPIHEEARREEHRIVYRAVDDALDRADRAEPLPVVVTGAERELALFEEVTGHRDLLVGRLPGNYARTSPDELATAIEPVLDAHRAEEQGLVAERVLEAHGSERAVTGLPAVKAAAEEGRGHLLVVEEGFTFSGHWVDGLTPGEAADEQLDVDEVVDDIIEKVLVAGGGVEFVADGSLADCGRIGLLLRY